MFNNHAADSPDIPADFPAFANEAVKVIREFMIGDDRYQVLVLDPQTAELNFEEILASLSSQSIVDHVSEITHFMLAGQLCLILKICNAGDKEDREEETVAEIQTLLTERELQIAALVALGKVNKQIAKQLHISEWTVATYLRRMFAKFSVDSRAALVYRCAPLIRKFQELTAMTSDNSCNS